MDKIEVIQALEGEREDLLRKLRSLEETILTLRQSLSIFKNTDGSYYVPEKSSLNKFDAQKSNGHDEKNKYALYPVQKNYRDKVAFILKTENRFLHMREIVTLAHSLENDKSQEVITGSVRQAVYALKDQKTIKSIKVDTLNVNTFWGSKNWLNEGGDIKAEYKYREDQLTTKKEPIELA